MLEEFYNGVMNGKFVDETLNYNGCHLGYGIISNMKLLHVNVEGVRSVRGCGFLVLAENIKEVEIAVSTKLLESNTAYTCLEVKQVELPIFTTLASLLLNKGKLYSLVAENKFYHNVSFINLTDLEINSCIEDGDIVIEDINIIYK